MPNSRSATLTDHGPVPVMLEDRLTLLEDAFNSAPVGLCLLDLQYRYIIVNECFARMYELPVGSFIGRTVREILPALADQVVSHLDDCLAAQALVTAEISFQRPASGGGTKETLFYQRTAQPIRDSVGNIVRISVALADVTERHRAEAALRESEENFRYTVDLNPHIPWAADAQGNIIFMSPRYGILTGREVHAPGESARQATVHPDDRSATMDLWHNAIATGSPFDSTYRLECAGGQWRWVRARALPRRASTGEILQWYGTLEDIHERKLIEEALQLKTARLEEVSGQLTLLVREDHLTGLANRRHFDDALEREAARARRSKSPLSLIMIDVDHFKRFNDTYGHPAGDACLKAVAGALGKVLRRQGDLAARYGGEEFVVLLPDTSEEGALVVALQAQSAVCALAIPHAGSLTGILTISAGVAMFHTAQQTASNHADLLHAADTALYSAKAAGRNRVATARNLEAQTTQKTNL